MTIQRAWRRQEMWTILNRHSSTPSINEANMTRASHLPLYTLPSGLSIQQANPLETTHLLKQIFVDNLYFQHGISLQPNSLVIDGGANIGMFTLFVLQHHPSATVIAVEPAPKTFQVLQANTSRFKTATVHNCALGREDGTMPFTYFPNSTTASGFLEPGDLVRLENFARSMILKSEQTPAALRQPEGRELLDYFVAERLKRQTIMVPVRNLSTLIGDAGIQRVHLLKLDIEGKEHDALLGVSDEHWARIDQLVIEVHDAAVTLPLLDAMLRERDFNVTSVRDAGGRKAMTYATRVAGRA
jgi:FkbM family methyltransferase